MSTPLFTVVTVVFHGEQLLPITAASVFNQTCTDYEYLIIDGGSTRDGTLALIEAYAAANARVRYISEPDRGLYDAMNKAIALAKGQYIWFMNAGDEIATPTTMQTMAGTAQRTNADVLYADTMLVNDQRQPLGLMSHLSTRTLPDPLTAADYLYGMRVVHQSFVPRLSLCEPYVMDNLCADYGWCIDILRKAKVVTPVPVEALSRYLAGGISKKRHQQSLKDRFEVMRSRFGLLATLWAHGMIVMRAVWHKLARAGKERY